MQSIEIPMWRSNCYDEFAYTSKAHGVSKKRLLAMTWEIMDTSNPVIKLCIAGSRAEFEHRNEDARLLYQQAWGAHTDDYEACIAAHYVARFQGSAEESLRWNLLALEHANAVKDEGIKDFYPSLYLSLGRSYELAGDQVEAERYYNLSAELGFIHQPD